MMGSIKAEKLKTLINGSLLSGGYSFHLVKVVSSLYRVDACYEVQQKDN